MQIRLSVISNSLKPVISLIIMIIGMSLAQAKDIKIPPNLIAELATENCDNPRPNPNKTTSLSYKCNYDDPDNRETGYDLDLIPLVARDFNKDGIEDLAVEVRSSGPMGASITTTSAIHYLLLDKNSEIIESHPILLYAPFSLHIVNYELKNNHLYYQAKKNYRISDKTYNDLAGFIEPPIDFEINWLNQIPVSTFYQQNCQLANRALLTPLKNIDGVETATHVDMHNYVKIIAQQSVFNSVNISASLGGCDSINLSFYLHPEKEANLPVLSDALNSLLRNTNYDQLIKDLIELDKQGKIVFGEVIPLNKDWNVSVHIQRSPESSYMTINFLEDKKDLLP